MKQATTAELLAFGFVLVLALVVALFLILSPTQAIVPGGTQSILIVG
jgi:hypothetical protein